MYTGTLLPLNGLIQYLPVKTPFFSGSSSRVWRCFSSIISLIKLRISGSVSVPEIRLSIRGCSGASDIKVTPKIVSGLVVKMEILSSLPSSSKSHVRPVDLPIQLRCMVRTFSGQPVSLSRSASSSSA